MYEGLLFAVLRLNHCSCISLPCGKYYGSSKEAFQMLRAKKKRIFSVFGSLCARLLHSTRLLETHRCHIRRAKTDCDVDDAEINKEPAQSARTHTHIQPHTKREKCRFRNEDTFSLKNSSKIYFVFAIFYGALRPFCTRICVCVYCCLRNTELILILPTVVSSSSPVMSCYIFSLFFSLGCRCRGSGRRFDFVLLADAVPLCCRVEYSWLVIHKCTSVQEMCIGCVT